MLVGVRIGIQPVLPKPFVKHDSVNTWMGGGGGVARHRNKWRRKMEGATSCG